MSRLPIRIRLTIWHTVVFGGIMLLFITGSLGFFFLFLKEHQDGSLKEDIEVIEQFLRPPFDEAFRSHIEPHRPNKYERFCEIWSPDGVLLFQSAGLNRGSLGPPPVWNETTEEFEFGSSVGSDGMRWRIAQAQRGTGQTRYCIRLAVSEEPIYEELRSAAWTLFVMAPFALFLVTVSGFLFSRRVLTPLEAMAASARRIGAQNLDEHLPVANSHDEFGMLAMTLNSLLERVRTSFEQLRQFTADVSHELRTPLTAMRSVGEIGLQEQRTSEEYRDIIGSMLEENSRLTTLVEKLLFLSRADSGRVSLNITPMDLRAELEKVAGLLTVLAEEKGQTLRLTAEECMVPGDRSLLRQAFINLVDNAIKYGPEGSMIDIRSRAVSDHQVLLEFADEGPGIPPEERDRVFQRFYRIDGSRSYQFGGAGLGLSVVHWIIGAHAGTVTVHENQPCGTLVRVLLPLRTTH